MGVPQSSIRVLLVEDDATTTEEMRAVVAARFTCEVVASGEAGIQAFATQPYDVVVSSARLKGMSGLELLDNVHEYSPSTQFILIGNDAALENVIDAGKRGASDYLLRPVDAAALSQSLDRAEAQ